MGGYIQADKARSQAAGDRATESAGTAFPDFHTAVLHGSARMRALAQLRRDLNNGPRVQTQQAFQRMLGTGIASQPAGTSAGRGVVQRVPEKTRITGITHLVRMSDESIYEGAEVMEVEDGDVVVIDNDDSILSRRGPNQNIYRDEDADGPQHYLWFKVLSVNNFPVGRDVFLRDRTFDALPLDAVTDVNPWLIYGTDGRTQQQIAAAISDGYRRFDCAESYRTSHLVAAALAAQRIPRRDVEIIYKFDLQVGETQAHLMQRLDRAFRLFGGRVDTLLIHNVEGSDDDLTTAWQVMNACKQSGMVREIGLGNITLERRHIIQELAKAGRIDAVENSLSSMLGNEDIWELIMSLRAKPYYYNVIRTAAEMGIRSDAGIRALIASMTSLHAESGMILSSNTPATASSNLAKFGSGPRDKNFEGDDGDALLAIYNWKKASNTCDTNDANFTIDQRVSQWLLELSAADPVRVRADITAASPRGGVTQASMEQWLTTHTPLRPGDFTTAVPERVGLKKYYVGMPLWKVLLSLFGSATCDWKWSIELAQLLGMSVQMWDMVGNGLREIVSK